MLKNIREQREERAATTLIVWKLNRNDKTLHKEANTQTFNGCRNHSRGDCRKRSCQHYLNFICFILPVIEIDVTILRMILHVANFPTPFYGFHALDYRFVWLTVMPERYDW